MTVDWTNWLHMTPAEQRELLLEYKAIVKSESERNKARWSRMGPSEKSAYPLAR